MDARPSWLEKLKSEIVTPSGYRARPDMWKRRLSQLGGTIDLVDGIERITTQAVFDILQLPRGRRGPKAYSRLAATMAELGWYPVRVRGMTPGRNRQIRCYERKPRWR